VKNTPQQYIQACSKLIGTPYEKRDCWGIVVDFYREVLGIELKSYYTDIPKSRDSAKALVYSSMGDFEEVKTPEFGDIILIKLYDIESHIAVYLGEEKMLHTTLHSGCVIERVSRWKHLIVGFYRVKKK
jgi:cell wall-associated NlpC family hydrolase